ncbi:9553_t:CDS:1, partial [Funneliformis geosporum]
SGGIIVIPCSSFSGKQNSVFSDNSTRIPYFSKKKLPPAKFAGLYIKEEVELKVKGDIKDEEDEVGEDE